MRTQLRTGGVPETVIDDAVLILSELLSNACKHGRPLGDALAGDGDVRAAWRVDARGRLMVEVTDGGGPTRPAPATPSVTAHGGRGLNIITALADDWGVRDNVHGEVTVWVVVHDAARGDFGREARGGGRAGSRTGGAGSTASSGTGTGPGTSSRTGTGTGTGMSAGTDLRKDLHPVQDLRQEVVPGQIRDRDTRRRRTGLTTRIAPSSGAGVEDMPDADHLPKPSGRYELASLTDLTGLRGLARLDFTDAFDDLD